MVGLHLHPAPLDGLDVQDHLLPVVRGDSFEWQRAGEIAFDLELARRETWRGLVHRLSRFRRRRRRGWYRLGGGGDRLGVGQTFGPVAPDVRERAGRGDSDPPAPAAAGA